MKRVIALSLLALAIVAGCAFVFWPREALRRSPQELPGASDAETPSPKIKSAPPYANEQLPVEPDADAWPRFLKACRAKEFSAAEQLLPFVVGLPVEVRTELLALPRELDCSGAEAAALRSHAAKVLIAHDERERAVICAAALAEYEKCWPGRADLEATRKASLAVLVDQPLNVPERDALLAGDHLFVDALLTAATESQITPLEQTRQLFERAASKNFSERTYLEPLLSGLLAALLAGANAGTSLLASGLVECRNLTPRLLWELRLIALGNSSVVRGFLKAIEPRNSRMDASLREAFKSGLTESELLLIIVPYLESRFGARATASALLGATQSWINAMTPEQRSAFALATVERFEEAEPGVGMASIYFRLLNDARAERDMKELRNVMFESEPDTSRATPLLLTQHASKLREAILVHRKRSLELLGDEPFPIENLADLCDAAIECSQDLREAVSALEQLLSPRKVLENRGLRDGFARVLMRVRARFAVELANDFVQREKLIQISEDVLDVTIEEFKAEGLTLSGTSGDLIQFADQLLAICAISPEIAVTSKGASKLRNIVATFEKECRDWEANPPVILPRYKRYVETYERVVARLKDPKLAPQK